MARPPVLGVQATPSLPSADVSPPFVDSVIIGSGPSAMLLSWILHGNHPYARPAVTPHPDPQLQAKLLAAGDSSPLFNADAAELSMHFHASRLSYSTQALPVNTLLDTLLRPLVDTVPGLHDSCIEWRHVPERAVNHIVLGAEQKAGGQWQAECVAASRDIGALSYAELLSLPQYSLEDHLRVHGKAVADGGLLRPSREDVSSYLAEWPERTGVSDSLRLGTTVADVHRLPTGGFLVSPQNIRCRRLVLATGIFSRRLTPRPLLQPLLKLHPTPSTAADLPLLVVGSGFSAADLILTHLPLRQRILHLFQWDPANKPSPLRACHPAAYPEYASVFRRMKRAAAVASPSSPSAPQTMMIRRRKSSAYAAALERPEWDPLYEGMPNTRIYDVQVQDGGESAIVVLRQPDGSLVERKVCGLEYVVGRRGSLEYLEPSLKEEVLSGGAPVGPAGEIMNKTLREKAEDRSSLEMATDVFAIGSLLGDSLIRHSYGGCVAVAAEVTRRAEESAESVKVTSVLKVLHERPIADANTHTSGRKRSYVQAGHVDTEENGRERGYSIGNGHAYDYNNGYDGTQEHGLEDGYEGRGILTNIDGHIMPMMRAYRMGSEKKTETRAQDACMV